MKIILLFLMIIVLSDLNCSKEKKELSIQEKAANIHSRVLTLDSHTDTPLRFYKKNYDLGVKHNPKRGKIDFPRMKEGGQDAVFFAVFIGQGPRTPKKNQMAKEKALRIFKAVHENVNKYPEFAELAYSPNDAYRLEKEGRHAVYMGIENGYPIGKDISNIKQFYDLGARYITLSHTKNNDICDSSTDPKGPEFNGLSKFGEKVVKEMNRLGMMVDVSHISDDAFFDVLKITKTPVIASHSCARAICDNPRNVTDSMLTAIKENGGVVQVCIYNGYVKYLPPNPPKEEAVRKLLVKYNYFEDLNEDDYNKAVDEWYAMEKEYPEEQATVSDVVDHIDHIVKIAGIDHVGIGTDFDGGGGIDGCNDVSEMGNITLELVKRGYTEEDITKIWGGNFMRVFRKVEKTAKSLN